MEALIGRQNRPGDLGLQLGLGVAGELALGPGASKAFASSTAAAGQDRATGLGVSTGQEAELTDTTLLGGLECSFHGKS
jgi:hypothetical protein